MTSEPGDPHSTAGLKDAVGRIRERAGELFRFGAKGLQVAAFLSEETDRFLVSQFEQAAGANGNLRHELCERCAVLAVGGSGRRDPAPWSDTDLLFLSRGSPDGDFNGFSSTVVRNLWDAGLRLGHTVQSVRDALTMSLEEIQFATSLADARLLWGSEAMFQQFHNRFARRCLERRLKRFVRQCVAERLEERAKYGATVNQLEPDVKRSLGGLRDLHLIRWIGFAWYRVSDFNGLRGRGALSYDDARSIQSAYEFLMHLRTDLHFSAGKEHDVLNRDEQLRIANARGFEEQSGQRPVERFMQTYFRHTAAVSRISDHFVDRHQPGSFLRSALSRLVTHRFDGVHEVGPHGINVATAHLDAVCGDIGRILRLYHAALLYDTRLSPKLVDTIRTRVAEMESVDMVSRECGKVFRRILRGAGNTGRIVREMYATGVLEYMIPEMARTRGLLQFNQYHSFTVDEHTLRAIEAVRRFEYHEGTLGAAYRAIRHKATLHLALLLHDSGKGFEEDHSVVGARIARSVGRRLQMSDHKREMMELLVLKHLSMPHLAFRRDISDADLLVRFAHEVGSPERLRMLYVLSAADISAVGPGAWTDWKSELLTDLYNRTMIILSGRPYQTFEEEHRQKLKQHVRQSGVPVTSHTQERAWREWVDERLESFPAHYLMDESPAQITRDLELIRQLRPQQILVEGRPQPETDSVCYRIITSGEPAVGCFHRLAGVLSGKRLGILSARISTTHDGVVLDSFRVIDNDYAGPVPEERINEVARTIRRVLQGEVSVEEVFQRGRRFNERIASEPISNLPSRVVIDNDSAERYTVIDVFAHDRPGLLYTVAHAIYELNLSVSLAKIATHVDQVVDVFYITDLSGRKLADGDHLREIRDRLMEAIRRFEEVDRLQFVS